VTTTARAALGTGALFVGGLLGGLLGSALFVGRGERAASEGLERVLVERDPELVEALRALTRELQVREAAPASEPVGDGRAPVRDDALPPSAEPGDLATAMERLARALEQRPPGGGGGIGLTPLTLPPPGHRADRLRALLSMDDEEASRQFRLWTYQQVLDHFGRPDSIREGGMWLYELVDAGDRSEFAFRFTDGFLAGIYY
jgi:hypothetical protein